MIGITFGQCLFQTSRARVEPDSDVHFGLLLYVSASPASACLRDDIAEVMWSGSDPDHGRHSLRQTMYRLRQLGFPLHLRAGRVVFAADLDVDVHALLRARDPLTRAQLLTFGTRPFLPGYSPKLGPVFSDWVDALREQVAGMLRRALVEAVRLARAEAAFRDVHKLARALLAVDPLNETGTLALAEALAMDGSKVEALRMLEEYEEEVGAVEENLRIPARTLRQRVSEHLGDALLPRRYEVPFVGRVEEFGALRRLFAESRRGAPRCAVITGEAGIGKTRLASELLRLAVLDGATVTTYTCTSGDTISPLSSLLHLTQAMLSLPGALGCGREHLQHLRRVVSSEAPAQSPLDGVSADAAYAQLVYSLTELAAAIADEAPLVMLIDDAHRLHQTSWRLFTDVADRMEAHGVLLIVTARHLPSWHASLGICGSGGRSSVIRLSTFVAEESRQFLDAWSEKNGVRVGPEDSAAIAGWSAGNPFYLSELAAHVARGADVTQAPPSVRGLIELQYAATTREAHRVLAVVSLLQSRATAERVTRALGIEPAAFVAALDELEETGLVVGSGADLRTKHDLVGEVALGLSAPGVLGYLRLRVAALLESEAEAAGDLELLGDSLGHWEKLGDSARVYEVGMRLGGRLFDFGFGPDASRAYLRAAAAGGDDARCEHAIVSAIEAEHVSRNYENVLALAQRRRVLQTTVGRSPDLTDLLEAEARYWAGSFSLPTWVSCTASDQRLGMRLRLRAAELLAIAADHHWDPDGMARVFDQVADLRGAPDSDAFLRLVVTTSVGGRKAVESAAATFLAAYPHANLAERTRNLRRAADALIRAGSRVRAVALLEESAATAKRLRLVAQSISAIECLIGVQLAELRVDEGLALLAEAHELIGARDFHTNWLHSQSEASAAWLSNDPVRARRALDTLPELAEGLPCSARLGLVTSWIAAFGTAGAPVPEPLLADAIGLVRRQALWGVADLSVAALLDALTRRSRSEEARAVGAEYAALLASKEMLPAPVLVRALATIDLG